jgi:putative ABC transport system permease protein
MLRIIFAKSYNCPSFIATLKSITMFKSLFHTAIRHILKHSGYSILNILGLTLGISSALFLIIYVSNEVSYDRYHEKADRIYRVSSKITETDDQFTWIVAQIPFGP